MIQEPSNLIVLSGDEINDYLKGLEFALDLLSRKLTELGYPELSRYCFEIIATCKCFRYSRGETGEGIDARLRVDPENSGLPHTVEFMRLLGEKVRADRMLKQMPAHETLVRSALEKIFAGSFPEKAHEQAIKRTYYESVLNAPMARKFEIASVCETQGTSTLRRYRVDWKGLDESKNLFLYYSMTLEQSARVKALHRCGAEHKLYKLLEERFGHGPRVVFLAAEECKDLHPCSTWRWVLGPYYSTITRNPEAVADLFAAADHPFIIRFRREEVKREGTVRLPAGTAGRGKNERELASDLLCEEYLISPFALKQELHELFSKEEREFTIFGVTDQGQLVV